MKQDYFEYNGRRYNSGDVIPILWHCRGRPGKNHYTGIFLCCEPERDSYEFLVNGGHYCYDKRRFLEILITESIDNNITYQHAGRRLTFEDELNIDGMLVAWLWYIVIMVILIIFKDYIVGWIGTSIIFFNYRKKKLREAGFK